ncbi:DUF4145 domain-containing protein [Halolamina sp. CBA1230]|uniref:DUF4145 domain-containing protein n=1 Tax=Halolamina sp. CBA1230 TaxID=1853690 RepID=UPI001C3C863A|nr:DUF4145 domain-containing protein [Halolamina sp. CBA1230]
MRFEGPGRQPILDGRSGKCAHCEEYTLWVGDEMVYPEDSPAPLPTEDMPEEVKQDFEEARKVVNESPRAAAALLRLAMEKLARDLTGTNDRTLHNMIGDLVEEGQIDQRVQQALDSVRVTGNEFVHPGEMDDEDSRETALRLFDLVNAIVELTISRERLIQQEYENISEDQMKGIENRAVNSS